MNNPHARAIVAALLTMIATSPVEAAAARLYDSFNSGSNWTLTNTGGGTASVSGSQLTLTCPANAISTATATLISSQSQVLTGKRQSILVRDHTGVANKTVFFLWATDPATGNKLELKINDQASTTMTAGYYSGGGGTYNFVASIPYSPGAAPERLYMAFRESGGTTYWEVSNDADTWTQVGSHSNVIGTGGVILSVQQKEYVSTTLTETIVDCLNYKATGAGYHNIEDKTYTFRSQADGWQLYREAFNGGLVCQSTNPDTTECGGGYGCGITMNCVQDHFTDGTKTGIKFHMTTDRLTNGAHAGWYMNFYRYQNLAFVDADVWTYHLYFKFGYPDKIHQGLEFPLNKYVGGLRLQGAVAWYPDRPDNLPNTDPHLGEWKVWKSAQKWQPTGHTQSLTPAPNGVGPWYELSFTVGLHDGNVYYSNFQVGPEGNMTTFSLDPTPIAGTSSSGSDRISPAYQVDNNTADTTSAGTAKDVWIAGWHIDWADEKLP